MVLKGKGSQPTQMINQVKRQPMEWEKIFANHIAGKGFNIQNI